jgi:hypothetical protein
VLSVTTSHSIISAPLLTSVSHRVYFEAHGDNRRNAHTTPTFNGTSSNTTRLRPQVKFVQSQISDIETLFGDPSISIKFEPDVIAWDESAVSALALARQSNSVSVLLCRSLGTPIQLCECVVVSLALARQSNTVSVSLCCSL